jgi:sugar (pentulose or hexulose) kinase
VLCILGRDPFGSLLEQAARSQGVDGHSIIVRRLTDASGARGCHLAFVGGSSHQPTGQMLAALGGQPILTITDARSGPQRGIIHFALVSGRVRFFIDEAAAAKRRLGISSRLLGLAVAVRTR